MTTEEAKELKYRHLLLPIVYTWKVWQLQLNKQQNSFPHKAECTGGEMHAATQERHTI